MNFLETYGISTDGWSVADKREFGIRCLIEVHKNGPLSERQRWEQALEKKFELIDSTEVRDLGSALVNGFMFGAVTAATKAGVDLHPIVEAIETHRKGQATDCGDPAS